MPGSTITPGHPGARDCALRHFAFRYTESVGTRNQFSIVAQWLTARTPADALPTSSRMPTHGSGPMWFAIPSSQWTCTTYSLPGLPAHPCENAKVYGFQVSFYPSQVAARPMKRDPKGRFLKCRIWRVFSHSLKGFRSFVHRC